MSSIVILAGGGPVPPRLREEIPEPDMVIAADSGYRLAAELGLTVDTVVGDMDSLTEVNTLPRSVHLVRHPEDKDATDLELAFELALREQPGRIVVVGGEGGRFDHEVAAIATICSDRWDAVPEIDWVRSDSISHVVRGVRRIQGDPGGLISLIPVGGEARGVSASGLRWPLDSETLHAGSSRGVSNAFARTEAVIRVEAGSLLAVVPDPTYA